MTFVFGWRYMGEYRTLIGLLEGTLYCLFMKGCQKSFDATGAKRATFRDGCCEVKEVFQAGLLGR